MVIRCWKDLGRTRKDDQPGSSTYIGTRRLGAGVQYGDCKLQYAVHFTTPEEML